MVAESLKGQRLRRTIRQSKLGAYLRGHFVLSSGLHTDELYQLSKAMRFQEIRSALIEIILEKCRMESMFEGVDVLVAVAMGGLPLMFELQRDPLFMNSEAIWVDQVKDPIHRAYLKCKRAERFKESIPAAEQEFILGRNFSIHPDQRVVIVDDVYTTGGSLRAAIRACNDSVSEVDPDGENDLFASVNTIGIIVGVNRSKKEMKSPAILMPGIEFVEGLRDPMSVFAQEACPMCKKGMSVQRL